LFGGSLAYRQGQRGRGGAGVVLGIVGALIILYLYEAQKPTGPSSTPAVTKAEYDQIKDGMTYAQVRAVIGRAEGERTDRGDVLVEELKGSLMNGGFRMNRLVYKYQLGLRKAWGEKVKVLRASAVAEAESAESGPRA